MFASSSSNGTLPATIGVSPSHMVEEYDDDDYSVVMVAPHWSPPSSPSLSPLSEAPSSPGVEVVVKSELTSSPDFRPSRLPLKVPISPDPKTVVSTKAAISPSSNNTYSYHRQDVPSIVNASASTSSPASRTIGRLPNSLETNVSSSIQNVLIQSPRRPPASNKFFSSSKDLAAHYGIPHVLPPAPRTLPRRLSIAPPSPQPAPPSPLSEFLSVKQNYLNMLSQKPTDTSMTAESQPAQPAVVVAAAADMAPLDPIMEEAVKVISEFMASPEFKVFNSFERPSVDMEQLLTDQYIAYPEPEQQHLTSPLPIVPSLMPDSYGESPYDESPLDDFLKTPMDWQRHNDNDMLTGAWDDTDYNDSPLFTDRATIMLKEAEQAKAAEAPPQPDFDSLLHMSPETPLLDSFTSPSLYPSPRLPSTRSTFPSPAPSTSSLPSASTTSRRRSTATGTRKGLTPALLVPIDAPTQPRKYISPSATSRKDLPAIFARKRSRSQAFEGEDELAEGEDAQPGPNATEKEQIEWKRRQNTLAARKSRKRKLLHQQELEESVERLTQEKEVWRTRALTLRQLLHSHGVPFNEFQD